MARMVKVLATAAACAVALAACGSSVPSPLASPLPSSSEAASSPAADLRVHMDLLLGEQVFVLAKLSVAGSAGRKDEFRSYTAVLAANGGDLTNLFRLALGETQGGRFGQVWSQGNNFFVDYMVAAVTHDQAKAAGAISNLTTIYVPQMAQLMSSALPMSMEATTQLAGDQLTEAKLFIDDSVAGNFDAMYSNLRAASAKATGAGDAIAVAIASRFPDKFPGAVSDPAAVLRSHLDALLQEHAYLVTMAADATIAATRAAQDAAGGALSANTNTLAGTLGTTFGSSAGARAGQLLAAEDASMLAYAKSADDASKQSALNDLNQTSGPQLASFLRDQMRAAFDVQGQIQAALQVIDDQRARSYDNLARDDRDAAVLLVGIGDAVTGATHG
jgi:hypothetical protein